MKLRPYLFVPGRFASLGLQDLVFYPASLLEATCFLLFHYSPRKCRGHKADRNSEATWSPLRLCGDLARARVGLRCCLNVENEDVEDVSSPSA